jgi:hypothetical protein
MADVIAGEWTYHSRSNSAFCLGNWGNDARVRAMPVPTSALIGKYITTSVREICSEAQQGLKVGILLQIK